MTNNSRKLANPTRDYLPDFDGRVKLAEAVTAGALNGEELEILSNLVFAISHPEISDDVLVESAVSAYNKLDALFYSTRERP